MAKRSRLLAGPVDGNLFAVKRLNDEIRNYAPVILEHTRSVSIKDPSDASVDLVLPVIIHHQGFGDSLALVVTGTNPDGIHVAPILFRLRMHLRVAVDFGSRGLEDARPNAL